MKTDRATEMLENARKQFQTNGAVWDDRTEAAVRSLISAHLLEVEHLTMPPEVVEDLVYSIADAYGNDSPDGAMAWLAQRYNLLTGEVLP